MTEKAVRVGIYTDVHISDDPSFKMKQVEPFVYEPTGKVGISANWGSRGNMHYNEPGVANDRAPFHSVEPVLARRRTTLPINDAVTGPVICLVQHRHDGTMLFTQEAICAVTQTAEKVAKERGGEWEVSKVRVLTRMERGDMPYGKDVDHLLEIVMIAMQPTKFQEAGPGWQSRINEELRKAAGLVSA